MNNDCRVAHPCGFSQGWDSTDICGWVFVQFRSEDRMDSESAYASHLTYGFESRLSAWARLRSLAAA